MRPALIRPNHLASSPALPTPPVTHDTAWRTQMGGTSYNRRATNARTGQRLATQPHGSMMAQRAPVMAHNLVNEKAQFIQTFSFLMDFAQKHADEAKAEEAFLPAIKPNASGITPRREWLSVKGMQALLARDLVKGFLKNRNRLKQRVVRQMRDDALAKALHQLSGGLESAAHMNVMTATARINARKPNPETVRDMAEFQAWSIMQSHDQIHESEHDVEHDNERND